MESVQKIPVTVFALKGSTSDQKEREGFWHQSLWAL